uniref:Uncharacterized protein n=1 Tax=Leersia perrieri TaxID=77586 RepID=A0A0D9W708_9ORYZ
MFCKAQKPSTESMNRRISSSSSASSRPSRRPPSLASSTSSASTTRGTDPASRGCSAVAAAILAGISRVPPSPLAVEALRGRVVAFA